VVGLHGGEGSTPLYEAELPTPAVLVVGAEGGGLGQRVRSVCDLLVSLPMVGKVASLNAATAGAIALYELVRRETETSEVESDAETEAMAGSGRSNGPAEPLPDAAPVEAGPDA
ncbi:MAG TPA: TrmH family RNA methyltransferase, partial [Thermomicrobiales bacterium]|nr:TrmH family RNA methyltransferase [Thermomicrobiales bacterium]